MDDFFNKLGETPIWVFGALGAVALGYRAMRTQAEPQNLNLTSMGIESCIGYAVCAAVPVVTPIVVIGVGYEDYHRRTTQKVDQTKKD